MKISALLYIDNNITDAGLSFMGKYLPEELKNRLEKINIFTSVLFSAPSNFKLQLKDSDNIFIKRQSVDDLSFWKNVFSETEADHIVKIFCDSPFLDVEVIKDMVNVHTKYFAEFTYSENLPSGFSSEIISRELIDALPEPEEKTLPLGQVIRSNINRFDVELYYKEPDIRDKRLAFRSGDPREMKIMENIATLGYIEYSGIKKIIDENPGVLYLSPSYIDIELTGRCDLDCIFCYRKCIKKTRTDMDFGILKKIFNDMKSFGLPYSLCFGGSGEPMMHNNFYEILDLSRNEERIKNIIIETNGILAGDNFKNYIKNIKDNRVKTIFNINGMDSESYKTIHNGDYFDLVFRNITSLKDSIVASDTLYIQIMKIKETEPFLDKYYDFWEKYNIPVILQKQNTYLGKIEDRTYSDLSPLERTPCWHLQRDFSILSDGRAMFCKQDIEGEWSRGNIAEKSIPQLFEKAKDSFLNDYKKKYSAKPDCLSCGEWYTFNL